MKAKVEVKAKAEATKAPAQTLTSPSTLLPHRPVRRHGTQGRTRLTTLGPYLNFSRQLHKLSREQGISGESFAMAAQVLLEKWQNRGLRPDVLAAIRTEVLNIGEPPA